MMMFSKAISKGQREEKREEKSGKHFLDPHTMKLHSLSRDNFILMAF